MNKQLFVPVITPMFQWAFDADSYKKLITTLDPHVDGFVPCLSSGEGHKMSGELWKEVLTETLKNTSKPVFVGIKRKTKAEVYEMLDWAKKLWAHGVTTPVLCDSESNIEDYLADIGSYSQLPIIIYNTETVHISDTTVLKRVAENKNIIGIKDSSGNKQFFAHMIEEKNAWTLTLHVFQWMENELHTSLSGDWFLISLANVEPELCGEYLETWDSLLLERIKHIRAQYNLWGNRYITLKAILMMRGVIRSAEEIDAVSF